MIQGEEGTPKGGHGYVSLDLDGKEEALFGVMAFRLHSHNPNEDARLTKNGEMPVKKKHSVAS